MMEKPISIALDKEASVHTESLPSLSDPTSAKAGLSNEKTMSLRTSFQKYPQAIFFSMTMSLCLIMEGFDTSLLNNFYALLQFRRRFGDPLPDGDYQLTASWMSGLSNGTQVGQICGLFVAGLLAERFGYKRTIIGALLLNIAFVFLLFFAQNIGMLFAGGVLCGLPWGAFQTLTTTYAADVTPIPLRPVLTTYVNMCWVIGQLIATGVLRGLLLRTDDWAWRIP
jgi:SP family general alpha glucoside:H+ symporter-like MFS transporter